MSIQIEYNSIDGKHIVLAHDGTIELYFKEQGATVKLDYERSTMLKNMIIAEWKMLLHK